MQHLASDFGNIIEMNSLPKVNVNEGNTMMGIISSFQRHYVDPDKTYLNMCTHTFGGAAITVVMETFRKFYILVEKESVKFQSDLGNNKVSEEENRSVKGLSSPPKMDVYKSTAT